MPFESIVSAVGLPGPGPTTGRSAHLLMYRFWSIRGRGRHSLRVKVDLDRDTAGFGHRGLGTDWLAQVHQHDPGWVWAWQRGELAGWSTWHGTGGACHRPRYRGGRAGAALRCRHQLIAMAAGHGRAAGVSGAPRGLRIPPRHLARAPGCCLPNIEKAVGRGEPILAYPLSTVHPARHFMILAF